MVSRKAVEFHLANIYAKLQVSSRSQLAARRDLRDPRRRPRRTNPRDFPRAIPVLVP